MTATTESDSADWNEFVSRHPQGSVYHRYEVANLIKDTFSQQPYYYKSSNQEGSINGVLPTVRLKSVFFGDYFVSLPFFNYGGVLADTPEIAQGLITKAAKAATQIGASHIEFRHIDPVSANLTLRQDKVLMVKPLPDNREALLKEFKTKLRAQIKRPAREGAVARNGAHDLLADFYQVFSENMRDLGTPVYSINFFRALLDQPWIDSTILVVFIGNEPTAAAFLIKDGPRMEIPWASTRRKFNRLSVNMCLYSEALGLAIDKGCSVFDFGRSSVDSGTYRFKKQWGAEPVQLNWQYWLADGQKMPALTPSNPKYQLAINTWQKLPLCIANFLGPKIIRSLP
ncbi:MAG: FemAB family PEP-CTERM system-associated protein [Gammaproteobacteria bacterium]|nr:MAG: FemAB family PEP-CTERM system-associated protein [Gammaproteobacteria bacterium]RLA11600.1 MAG: FemAB family PEP-CTERM system-associated protein [Gammaproteobacteria bacterium]